MKRGLVIGKFMPVHEGHISLIRFAADQVDELIVSMSYTLHDPIDHNLRYQWLKEIFSTESVIRVEMSLDDFDDTALALEERTGIWSKFIKNRFPPINVLFTSEEYGNPFAAHLGIPHIEFDKPRTKIPISATLIRSDPFKYWDYIPEVVRPYFVKKICFYGPESTGKSTLATYFAERYQTEFVPEVARELLTSNDFTIEDIIRIGYAQTQRVIEKTQIANRFIFCDTDLITTEIYSEHYLHDVPAVLLELESQIKYDLYFLLDTDVAWMPDGLRDLGEKRSEMFRKFKDELEKRSINYVLVQGNWEERIAKVQVELDKRFPNGIEKQSF